MAAYYNEFDAHAAAWLRELIKDGLIPDGEVDERDMREVDPEEIRGFTQYHFFAGIGGWAYALRLAGWPDDRPVMTGSPPCQPFSLAGKQKGVKDERHLAPKFLEFVRLLQPPVIFGEQVANAVTKDEWLDDLLNALEAEGYATGAVVLPACGIGAPHIRQRLWFTGVRMANGQGHGLQGTSGAGWRAEGGGAQGNMECGAWRGGACGGLANGNHKGLEGRAHAGECTCEQPAGAPSLGGGMGNATSIGSCRGGQDELSESAEVSGTGHEHVSSGFWDDSQWLYCRDGKLRPAPTEPALFPLADGVSNRVGLLRGAGNAIVPQVAAEIIGSVKEWSEFYVD